MYFKADIFKFNFRTATITLCSFFRNKVFLIVIDIQTTLSPVNFGKLYTVIVQNWANFIRFVWDNLSAYIHFLVRQFPDRGISLSGLQVLDLRSRIHVITIFKYSIFSAWAPRRVRRVEQEYVKHGVPITVEFICLR